MEPRELQRLQIHYATMGDDELHAALYYGPDAYASSEVWKVIAEEASRRGIAVPTEGQLLEHEAARVRVERADQAPPVPWGWALYIVVTRVTLGLLALYCVDSIVHMLNAPDHHEGWHEDLRDYLGALGVICVVAWARHRHLVAVRERWSGGDRPPGAA